MSKVIKRLNAYGMGGTFDQPGYEYDPVNDTFKDLETGKVFSKDYVAPTSGTGTVTPTVKLEDNRIKIIDATQYTEPVEVTPSQGKDAMKKVTVTVSNIPNASVLESNKAVSIDVSQYTEPVEITPTEGKDGMEQTTVTLTNIPSPNSSFTFYAWGANSFINGWTLSETPQAGDTFYVRGNDSDSIRTDTSVLFTVESIGEGTINISGNDYSRISEGDITFPITLMP